MPRQRSILTVTMFFTSISLVLGLQFVPLIGHAADTALQNPLGNIPIWELFARVAGGLNFVTGTLALFFIVLGGYRILSAAGNSEHFEKGKQMIVYALLGLILTIGSYTILATTITVLTGKEGPAPFITSTTLVDPLNLSGLTKPAAFVLYGERILGFLLSGLGGLSTLMFVYAGVLWLTAAGNEERITKAKKTMLYATIGLVVVLSSYAFISFVYAPFYSLFSGS